MKTTQKSKFVQALVALTALTALTVVAVAPSANAATKTIRCYKGTVVKKVTAVKPKCPAGYRTTKPVAKPVAKPTAKSTAATIAFSGTYTGKIGLLWGDSYVQATSVEGTGTGNVLGLTDLSGVGSAAPANQCDTFNGSGTLSGGGNTLKLTFDSTAKACAEDADAPTGITFTGNAVINGGTGKYAGATGTLKVTAGSFAIKSTVAGKSETDTFKMTISGNIITK